MATTVEDNFFDFDINFLHQNSDSVEAQTKLDKYRKSILVLKKKVVLTNSLIRKYYTKREQLEQSEKSLVESKEECKKICVDYSNALENCNKLEADLQLLQIKNKELEEKYFNAQNQCVGIQSHANQLQQLIVEHESQIKTLKLEHKLCKSNSKISEKSNTKSSDKTSEKEVRNLKNEIVTLRKHISLFKDIILDKRKLKSKYKLILQKYDPYDGSSESDEETSDHDDYIFSAPTSPIGMEDDTQETLSGKISNGEISREELKHIKMNDDNDILEISKRNENDGSSVDTGRGSSLACSDSEKIIQSPNYFLNGSPLSESSTTTRQKTQYKDVATSPLFVLETVPVSTSPISFNCSKFSQFHSLPNLEQNKVAKITTDTVVVNTIYDCLTTERSITPIEHNKCVRSLFSPSKEVVEVDSVTKTNKTSNSTKTNNERACLESNNSNNICNDNSNDGEIEAILQTMRLNYDLVTPIPISPAKSVRESTGRSITANQQREYQKHFVCSDAVELKEENKKLHASIADLAKEVMNIKNLLQNQMLSQSNAIHSVVHNMNHNTHINTDSGYSIIFNDEDVDLNEIERPSSAQTAIIERPSSAQTEIIEPLEQVIIRSPSPSTQNTFICNSDILCMEDSNDVNKTHNALSTEDTPSSRLEFEDSTPFPVNFNTPDDNYAGEYDSNDEISSSRDHVLVRPFRRQRRSKLNMLKKTLIPKSKIKRYIQPTQKKKRLKPKPIIIKKKRKVLDTDNSASLNEKSVYEKAVQIMSEIKAKQSTDTVVCPQRVINTVELNTSTNTNNVLDLLNSIESQPKPMASKSVVKENKDSFLKEIDNTGTSATVKADSILNSNEDNIENESVNIEVLNSACSNKIQDLFNDIETKPESTQPKATSIDSKRTHSKDMNAVTNPDSDEGKSNSIQNGSLDKFKNESTNINKTLNISHKNEVLNQINDIEARSKSKWVPEIIPIRNNTRQCKNTDVTSSVSNAEGKSSRLLNSTSENITTHLNKMPKLSCTSKILDLIDDIESRPKSPMKQPTHIEKNIAHSNDLYNVKNKVYNDKDKAKSIQFSNKDDNKSINKSPKEHCSSECNETDTWLLNKRRITRSTSKNIAEAIKLEYDNNSQDVSNESYQKRKCLKRRSQDLENLETPSKRILRSSTIHTRSTDHTKSNIVDCNTRKEKDIYVNESHISETLSYSDIDMFSEDDVNSYTDDGRNSRTQTGGYDEGYKGNILCSMLHKYGVTKVTVKKRKVSDNILSLIRDKLEKGINKIIELPSETAKNAMDALTFEMQKYKYKEFVYGLMKYLQEPTRKTELYKKVNTPPAPPMSKSEQVLLYIINQLSDVWRSVDFVDVVLSSIEYTLFCINRTPEFDVIESMSHFYAVLCRYCKAKRRLRLFILDAMYCLQFKSIVLIKQCFEVWMHVLPLAHMGVAKTPLVTCLVYLLHFYKCEDKFNRVSEIRTILSRKYFFKISNWSEDFILQMFRTAIMELKGNNLERKMLRVSLLIFGKRMGPKWCQKNIVNNMLKPIIDKHNVRENIRVFCITMLGPLLKPYPVDMKVHHEIIANELVEMLQKPASSAVQEAIVTSVISLARHSPDHVVQALLCWKPKEISPQLEDMLRNYVRSKPLKTWKFLLTKPPK